MAPRAVWLATSFAGGLPLSVEHAARIAAQFALATQAPGRR